MLTSNPSALVFLAFQGCAQYGGLEPKEPSACRGYNATITPNVTGTPVLPTPSNTSAPITPFTGMGALSAKGSLELLLAVLVGMGTMLVAL